MRNATAFLVVALVACVPSQARGRGSDSVDAACRSAMAPYYAALLASARSDADGTLRHLVALKSRWNEVLRAAGPDAPAWIRSDVDGGQVGPAVAARIEAAWRRLPADVSGAHAELERVRALLRDARLRHGARTPDDALTDYHDAMERLSSHIGASNEIALAASDFVAIRSDVGRARTAWMDAASLLDIEHAESPSNGVSAATMRVLNTITTAADGQDAMTAQNASRELKSRYFDLLAVLARRQ